VVACHPLDVVCPAKSSAAPCFPAGPGQGTLLSFSIGQGGAFASPSGHICGAQRKSTDAAHRLQLSKYPILVSVEQRTQVPKAYAFIGAVTLLTLLHFINTLAAPVSNLIGWGLPAYLSLKALESPGNDDDAQWLAYWVIFGFFNFAEGFALRALLYYFPWYFSFKTLFILWLQLPAFRVSTPYYRILLSSSSSVSGCTNNLLQRSETCFRKRLSPQRLCPHLFQ